MKKQTKKRIYADVSEEYFKFFKELCDEAGADMKEVVLLGLKPGFMKYIKRNKHRLEEIEEKIGVTFFEEEL